MFEDVYLETVDAAAEARMVASFKGTKGAQKRVEKRLSFTSCHDISSYSQQSAIEHSSSDNTFYRREARGFQAL